MTEKTTFDRGWRSIERELMNRYALFGEAMKALQDHPVDDATKLRLAATDVFVEKAQHRLGSRALWLILAGSLSALAAVAALTVAAVLIYSRTARQMMGGLPLSSLGLTVVFIKALSFGGFIGGAAYFLGALAQTFFHEAMVLYNRRHALRFGRLAVYLDPTTTSTETLLRVFRWSDEFGSAFKDMKPEALRDTALARLLTAPPETVNALVSLLKPSGRKKD